MRRTKRLMRTATTVILLCVLVVAGQQIPVKADVATTPSLVVSQIKITSSDGQFVTLFNTTNSTLDMSKYQLEYFNNYDLSKATSSRLIALSGMVPPHSYYMVNDSALLLCYKLTINSVSLGFSSTAGLIQVLALQQFSPGGSVGSAMQDYVGWSKTASAGAQTLPVNTNVFLQRQPVDSQNNPSITTPGAGSWQQVQRSSNDSCGLITASTTPSSVPTGLSLLLPPTEPPSTIVSIGEESDTEVSNTSPTGVLPSADIGLMSPQITELLPNPIGTGNDSTDEYIELYNPNNTNFDLTGFTLQSGLTSLHTYVFPSGTNLAPKAFTAFYSETTGLSLNNTSGQVKLLDPFGNSINSVSAYTVAKDGQSWALAKGKWYWSTYPTAGAANVIKQPVSKKAKTASAKNKANPTNAKVKGSKTAKSTKATALTGNFEDHPTKTPIHPWTLALVGGLALLYGAYEYRADMANRIYQLKRYFRARRTNRG